MTIRLGPPPSSPRGIDPPPPRPPHRLWLHLPDGGTPDYIGHTLPDDPLPANAVIEVFFAPDAETAEAWRAELAAGRAPTG